VRTALTQRAAVLQPVCGGRLLPAPNIHLTLAFLGHIAPERLAELKCMAAALTAERFTLMFDHAGYWRQPRIVWAGLVTVPPALEALAAVLDQGLRAHGFRTESRKFIPHVTLLRDARSVPPVTALEPLSWPVRRFVLAHSCPVPGGVRYDIAGSWPLQAG